MENFSLAKGWKKSSSSTTCNKSIKHVTPTLQETTIKPGKFKASTQTGRQFFQSTA